MYCQKCGQANADDSLFCEKCGADLRTAAPTSGGGNPGFTAGGQSGSSPFPTKFDIMGTIKRAINLVKNPAAFMTANKDADPPINSLMIYYVAVLALIPLVAILLGDLWYYGAYRGVGYGYAFGDAILTYILEIIAVFVVGIITWKLAPSFGTSTTQVRATVLTAYAYTPYFLVSVFYLIPIIGIIALLGALYGLYITYLGLPILLNTPKDKVIIYLIVLVIVVIVVNVVINTIIAGALYTALVH